MKNKKIIFRGEGFSLVSEYFKARGKEIEMNIVRYPKTVAIIPVPKRGRVMLIKQYRHPFKKKIWEIPAGKLDLKESPLRGAKRELREETGFVARKWKKLFSFYISPGYSTEYM
ncbi:MAG: ADP-ribose pyrophosphatase, partial [Thermoplasmata archaeon]